MRPPALVADDLGFGNRGAFGRRVRARREELDLSQEAAADQFGVHWTYLGQVERGQRPARVENILKLAYGLDTTPGALLDGVPFIAD